MCYLYHQEERVFFFVFYPESCTREHTAPTYVIFSYKAALVCKAYPADYSPILVREFDDRQP